jgi:Pentapeptide repeats (8 copies)
VWVTLLIVVGLAVLAGGIYVLPWVLVPDRRAGSLAAVTDPARRLELEDERLRQRNDVRVILLQSLAGAVVVVGLSLTWRQVRVNQEGQITERFTRAIDHLGSDKLDLRLGGIYALERIAKSSNHDRDTIAEILAAFVHQRSPWPPSQPGQYRDDFPIDQQPELRTRAADVQAVLTVLGRTDFTRHRDLRLDLAEVDLRRAALHGADLDGAILSGAHLDGADLSGAHLDGAILSGAHLDGADLSGAHLDGAILSGAHLDGADLSGAHLDGAILAGARLRGADLSGAHLYRAILSGADLHRVILRDADLQGSVADERTQWPDAFDAASNGIEFHKQAAG